jgi:hypothetical protein
MPAAKDRRLPLLSTPGAFVVVRSIDIASVATEGYQVRPTSDGTLPPTFTGESDLRPAPRSARDLLSPKSRGRSRVATGRVVFFDEPVK